LKKKHGGPREGAGRKVEDGSEDLKRYNVSLDAHTVKKAKVLGDGNMSAGIRKRFKDHG
jgi:hypothetical protein